MVGKDLHRQRAIGNREITESVVVAHVYMSTRKAKAESLCV